MQRNWDEVISICKARNGERCKDCIMQDDKCAEYKKEHRNTKPCDYAKYRALQYYKPTMKGDKNNG